MVGIEGIMDISPASLVAWTIVVAAMILAYKDRRDDKLDGWNMPISSIAILCMIMLALIWFLMVLLGSETFDDVFIKVIK